MKCELAVNVQGLLIARALGEQGLPRGPPAAEAGDGGFGEWQTRVDVCFRAAALTRRR